MTNKFTDLFKLTIITFGIFFFLTNCEKDTEVSEQQIDISQEVQKPHFIIKTVFKDKIQSNPKLKNKLNLLNERLLGKNSKNIAGKGVYNKKYDFVIDTNSATYIKDGEYHSYTFPIKQSPEQNIRNVFFSLNEDGEYDSYLIEYRYTKSEMAILDADELSKRTKMTKIDIELSSLVAKFTSKWVCTYEYKSVDGNEGNLVGAGKESTAYTVTMTCGIQYGYDSDYYDEYDPIKESSYDPNDGTTTYTGGGSFVSSPTFSIYDEEDLAMYHILRNELSLDNTEYDFIYGRYDITTDLFHFLSLESFSVKSKVAANHSIDQVMATGNENIDKEDFKEFLRIAIKIPSAKLERYLELNNLLENNPWVLIQDCAQQNGLDTSNYIDLYNLPFPQECSDRLFNMGVEWHHQPITDGNVPLANIDYYGVEVTNYPDFNKDGNPDSETEMYQAFREKFIDFGSGKFTKFSI